MRRIHSFEIADLSWCPDFVRRAGTEFLTTVAKKTRVYRGTAAVLIDVLNTSGTKNIVVLGAGSGGDIEAIACELPVGTSVTLTDLHPDHRFKTANPAIQYCTTPIDAFAIPPTLSGVRVLYSVFHHFEPTAARKLLASTLASGQPIAVFEVTERSLQGMVIALLVPVLVLLLTPWVKPFSLRRLFFTYVIPILPLFIFWDGLISSLRTYSLAEMQSLTKEFTDYVWKTGVAYGPRRERVLYLTGVPCSTDVFPKTPATGVF